MYISEFSRLTGTTTKTIRYYESIGLLPEPIRKGRYRLYTDTYIETVKQIKLAQTLGFTLKDILRLCDGQNIERGLPKIVLESALAQQKQSLNAKMDDIRQQLSDIEVIEQNLSCPTPIDEA